MQTTALVCIGLHQSALGHNGNKVAGATCCLCLGWAPLCERPLGRAPLGREIGQTATRSTGRHNWAPAFFGPQFR